VNDQVIVDHVRASCFLIGASPWRAPDKLSNAQEALHAHLRSVCGVLVWCRRWSHSQ
jgi:hypothetical protein